MKNLLILLILVPGCRSARVLRSPVLPPSDEPARQHGLMSADVRGLLAQLEQIGMDDALERQISEVPTSTLLPELERAIGADFGDTRAQRELRAEQYRGALLRVVVMLRNKAERVIPILLRQERLKLLDIRYNDGTAYAYTVGALGFVAWPHGKALLASEDATDRRIGRAILDGLTQTEGLTREERITISRDITNYHTLGEWSWETECLLKAIVYLRVVDHRAVDRIKALCTTAEEWSQRTLCDGFLKEVEPVGQIK